MTASDNDVYIKSMDGQADELKQTHSQQQLAANANKGTPFKTPQLKMDTTEVNTPSGVAAWGTSFERLLEEPAGLHTFSEFLKKEFSAENIYFWTACERFRQLDNVVDREAQARAIFAKHLANGAHEPVNVDSQARNMTEEKLQSAERDIFAHAQKQIFNLMKFDSYQRFIRSDLYKSCVEAEERHQPLPFTGEDLDDLLRINFSTSVSSKLKKSASNAEDRRRKSLLPWHRKMRSKSRDRNDNEATGSNKFISKLPQLTGHTLKVPSSQNSLSDIHSSRSSLSSFDALPGAIAANGQAAAEVASTLCRVILSDGATTVASTRAGETVGQLVERLLEKRGLVYKFYDVVFNGSTKSIDLQLPSQTLAGKEVLIEQRVAFKLDLPDPKVISVKSKPKKQLHEVLRPILHKYNYDMAGVLVLVRDSRALLDLSLPVSVVEGQRLQVVLNKPLFGSGTEYQNSCMSKFVKPAPPKGATSAAVARNGVGGVLTASQSTLDEITNKVFNELLQGKVEAHANDKQANELCSLKSDDCASETSSIFDRMRRHDTTTHNRLKLKKKSTSSQQSEETNQSVNSSTVATSVLAVAANVDIKKPIIAKLKAGVTPERVSEHQDELLEGLKRAQLARLEDQRGTEINNELPEFLKNKENLSIAASKLRKVRENLNPVNRTSIMTAPANSSIVEEPASPSPACERPQPAPRLSITNKNKPLAVLSMTIDEEPATIDDCQQTVVNVSNAFSLEVEYPGGYKGPPPLPPKPKVLPIKPSNWGVNSSSATTTPIKSPTSLIPSIIPAAIGVASKIPIDIARKTGEHTARCAYLEEPSSSFV